MADKLTIKVHRAINQMSQQELAEMLGVQRETVSNWENGKSHPTIDKVNQMCNIFKCSLDEIDFLCP